MKVINIKLMNLIDGNNIYIGGVVGKAFNMLSVKNSIIDINVEVSGLQ
jgi:hypothetical protein